MCCPKFDAKAWAFGCAYLNLIGFGILFVFTIPFVFHPGLFNDGGEIANVLNQAMAEISSTVHGRLYFVCFGSLFIAFVAYLCVYGIQKDKGGYLVPYLVVQYIFALLFVVASFYVFYVVVVLQEIQKLQVAQLQEFLNFFKVLLVLLVLVGYWVTISPVFVVTSHCHRLMTTSHGYSIAAVAPVAQETIILPQYAGKSRYPV